jgi:hypothetical protein
MFDRAFYFNTLSDSLKVRLLTERHMLILRLPQLIFCCISLLHRCKHLLLRDKCIVRFRGVVIHAVSNAFDSNDETCQDANHCLFYIVFRSVVRR